MARQPHLFFRNPQDGVEVFKYLPRGFSEKEEEDEEPKEDPRADTFQRSISRFNREIERRHKERNEELVEIHFDYIEITFFATFESKFESRYKRDFGLIPIKRYDFNRKILWMIQDHEKFENFKSNIDLFIKADGQPEDENFNNLIRFVKDFELLTTEQILKINDRRPLVHLTLLHSVELDKELQQVVESLKYYLDERAITYIESPLNSVLEIENISIESLQEIAQNFDVLQSINSFQGGTIRPGIGTAIREYGFEVNPPDKDIPIIGIIDSGIQRNTPIDKLILNRDNNDYDITGTGCLTDNADHGTAVACLAALGEKPYEDDFTGTYDADAKLLSIKIIDPDNPYISEKKVEDQIRKAYEEYGVRIFVLTVGYTDYPKLDNDQISDYAVLLDKLTYELDILIFISATNNNDCIDYEYPAVFDEHCSNLAAPADSYNNLTVGAIAGNVINDLRFANACVATGKDFPAFYTRKGHYNFEVEGIKGTRIANSRLRKPDCLHFGGDYSRHPDPFVRYSDEGEASLKVLSAERGEFFKIRQGTSFSAPLLANVAARIIREYPDLDMKSVKALLINSCSYSESIFQGNLSNILERRIMGYGIPNSDNAISSSTDKITILLNDEITPGEIKTYPIHLPKYLNVVERKASILKFTATLSFKSNPYPESQLEYCPLHIGFGVFKNVPIVSDEGRIAIATSKSSDIRLKTNISWSQDAFNKKSLLSNLQSMSFNVKKEDIINEDNTFKIAIASRLHPNLPEYLKEVYTQNTSYSLAISVEELGKNPSGRLYNEMRAINRLEVISEIEIDTSAEEIEVNV